MTRTLLRLALPSIVSNLAIPLLGLVDTAIVGHMGEASAIAAVAVGTLLFNMTYWLFGFLRMSTGGLTAQALGAGRDDECLRILARSGAWAMGLSLLIWLLQRPICTLSVPHLAPDAAVAGGAERYFSILVWGAPAVLSLYSIHGWLLGMQDARRVMLLSIIQNAVNLPVSLILVYGLGMQIEGIATGTLVAQYTALASALWMLRRHYRRYLDRTYLKGWAGRKEMGHMLRINGDIFLRMLCLIAVTYTFTACGSRFGTLTLAANALLMQFFLFFSYFMDGFAFAGEALSGRYLGARDIPALRRLVRQLFAWGGGVSLVFSAVYIGLGEQIVQLLTTARPVVDESLRYLPWVACIPVAGCGAFLLDGVFIGLTDTRPMLRTMLAATLVFLIIVLPTGWWPHNGHVLWLGFLAYLLLRGAGLAFCLHRSRHFVQDNENILEK